MKGWTGLASDFLKRPPALLSVAGVLFLALAVTTSLGIRDFQVAAESGIWRYVSAGSGVLLILAGVAFHWLESRSATSKKPGPYTTSGNFPLRIEGPADKIFVFGDGQKFTVKGIRKGSEWPEYRVMLMHVPNEKEISPRFNPIGFRPLAGGEFSWETEVGLPDPETITRDQTWRLAFFYVGPNAQHLVDHHEAVCKYFAPDGKPKGWPPIKDPFDEFVRCSEVLSVPFGRGALQQVTGA